MASVLPLRLLGLIDGEFEVFDPRSPYYSPAVEEKGFDIISYAWSEPTPEYKCEIEGVYWELTINMSKIEEIKRLMRVGEKGGVLPFMWVDCLCMYLDQYRTKCCRNLTFEPLFSEGFGFGAFWGDPG